MGVLNNAKLIVLGVVVLAFLALGGMYKLKSVQLEQARANLAQEQANNAALQSQVAVHQQNTVAVQASQASQQARQNDVGKIRERIVTVQTEVLSDVEKDICAIITRLFNLRVLVKSTGSDTATKGVLPKAGEGTPAGTSDSKGLNQ